MGENSKIAWTHHTFNVVWGCTKVSPGCANCYAAELDAHKGGDHWGPGKPRKLMSDSYWRQPVRWDKEAAAAGERRRVFCSSMADWLDPAIELSVLARLMSLIARTPNLDWLLLTKRPELWATRLSELSAYLLEGGGRALILEERERAQLATRWLLGWAPPNVWVGVSVEDQLRAEERIPLLLAIPAAIRFLSMEPLLGPVDFRTVQDPPNTSRVAVYEASNTPLGDLDWVIVGGESGTNARPFMRHWLRDVLRQCDAAGVPVFVKQLGDRYIDPTVPAGLLVAPKGGDMAEWPVEFRRRAFPARSTYGS